MEKNFAYFNGSFLPESEIRISPKDLGVTRGLGSFDYVRTFNGVPFMLDRHMDRFMNSSRLVNVDLGMGREELVNTVTELHRLNGDCDCAFRLIATGGVSEDAFTQPATPTFFILSEALPVIPDKYFTNGISIITLEHLRTVPEAKTTDYLAAMTAAPVWSKKGAIDALFVFRGEVLEATRANFAIFKGDTLVTSSRNILEGITRRTVLELAKKHFGVEVRPVSVEELWEADEAFISGTTKKTTPVVNIDGRKIGTGAPGKRTLKLLDELETFVSSYCQERLEAPAKVGNARW